MAKRVQWIGHITTQANEFAGREREITVDITTNELRVHDGSTPGGHRILNLEQLQALFQPFGNSDFETITVDTINEHTGNAGVTIDSVLIKDGLVDGIDLSVAVPDLIADILAVDASLAAYIANVANPHAVTKAQVGLGSVTDNAQLKIASNLSDLANAATARNNLGLGSLATLSAIASAQITDGTIVNADINASAAIDLSKLATQAANTVVMNSTGGVAVPAARAIAYPLAVASNILGGVIQVAYFADQKAAGVVDGGNAVADTWTKRTCDDSIFNTITGLTQAASVFTFATNGTYLLYGICPFLNTGSTAGSQIRIRNTSDGVTLGVGSQAYTAAAGSDDKSTAFALLTIAGGVAKNVEMQYWHDNALAGTLGTGNHAGSGEVAVFAQLFIVRVA